MICGQLHHERSRIACKHSGLFQNNAGADNGRNPHKVSGGSHPPCASEEGTRNQTDNWQLCAAGDKGCGHDSHLPVAVVFDGS